MTTRLFVGFDCSSKTVHATILDSTGKLKACLKWESKQRDFDGRFVELMGFFTKWVTALSHPEQYTAVIENPIYVQNLRATSGIAHTVAGVKWELAKAGVVYNAIDNKVWKKYVVGNGAASKELIMKFAKQRWGDVFEEQDFADAACLALWGVQRFVIGKKEVEQ